MDELDAFADLAHENGTGSFSQYEIVVDDALEEFASFDASAGPEKGKCKRKQTSSKRRRSGRRLYTAGSAVSTQSLSFRPRKTRQRKSGKFKVFYAAALLSDYSEIIQLTIPTVYREEKMWKGKETTKETYSSSRRQISFLPSSKAS